MKLKLNDLDGLKEVILKYQGIVADYQAGVSRLDTKRELITCEYLLLALDALVKTESEENKINEINKQKDRVVNLLKKIYKLGLNEEYVGGMRSKEIVKQYAALEFLAAIEKGYDDLIQLGLTFGKEDIKASLAPALTVLINKRQNEYIGDVIAAGADPKVITDVSKKLDDAVRDNDSKALEGLLQLPQAVVNDSLIASALNYYKEFPDDGNLKKITLLIENLRDIKFKTHAAFKAAITLPKGNIIIKSMMNHGYDCTPELFVEALVNGSIEVITEINRQKDAMPMNKEDGIAKAQEEFFTASLHAYRKKGFNDEMYYLLRGNMSAFQQAIKNRDVNQVNAGESILMTAVRMGRNHFAIKLLQLGANPNKVDPHKITPLMDAVRKENNDALVAELIKKGASVNETREINGQVETALSLALRAVKDKDENRKYAYYPYIEMLLATKDIDLTLTCTGGKTLMELGLQSENQTVRQAFQIKKEQPSMKQIEDKLQQEIDRLTVNAASCFGIGNKRKADRIQKALDRARSKKENLTNVDAFLTYKQAGASSIEEALLSHRIGFFGIPNTAKNVNSVREKLSLKKSQ